MASSVTASLSERQTESWALYTAPSISKGGINDETKPVKTNFEYAGGTGHGAEYAPGHSDPCPRMGRLCGM